MRPIRSAKILVAVGAVILTILADSCPFTEAPNVGAAGTRPFHGSLPPDFRARPGKTSRFAASHISRKTSEMWGTPGSVEEADPTSDLSRKLPQDLFRGEQVFLGIDPDGIEGSVHHVDTDPLLEQS